ncbi:MAG TPA: serine/threonine protein kinase [Burkholderiales bacterium]|nr:serine/threonine protein kinase [Burkholderiales bacterium]
MPDASPSSGHPYDALTPDVILAAVERCGYRCDGRLFPLNSFENRVYQVGIEEAGPLVVKFYRPARWSAQAIREEHAFALELAAAELPVVAPLVDAGSETLHQHDGFLYSLAPRQRGRAPDLEQESTLEWMGRFIGRIHAVGALHPFRYRPTLDVAGFGDEPCAFLREHGFIPADLVPAYETLVHQVLAQVRGCFERAGDIRLVRLHGDCHAGNVLWDADGPHFVDLDDSRMGPAVQDLWMLLSGERDSMQQQLRSLLRGYRGFQDFDARELNLIEALRTLRLTHYAAWLARRWDDPAFPVNFPWFNTQRYWQDHILALREQAAAMQEPPLAIDWD